MKTDLMIGNKTYDCKLLTIDEYIHIASAKAAGIMKDVLPVILDKRVPALPKHLAQQLFFKLMCVSRKRSIVLEHGCECGKVTSMVLDEKAIQVTDEQDLRFDLGEIQLQFRYPKLYEDMDLAVMIDKCIVSVFQDGAEIRWEDASTSEKNMVLEYLTFEHLTAISALLNAPYCYVAKPGKCECGKSFVAVKKGFKILEK